MLQEFFEDLEHATKPHMHRKPLQQGGLGGVPVAALRPLLDKACKKLIAVRPCALFSLAKQGSIEIHVC